MRIQNFSPADRFRLIGVFFLVACAGCASLTKTGNLTRAEIEKGRIEDWPQAVADVRVASSGDGTEQHALFYASKSQIRRPLLVALHSWSGGYLQKTGVPYANWCIANDWIFIHPDFRGQNNRPQAMGSELVVADILSAVTYAKQHANVDESRIYLAGGSGGGFAALLLAGRAPEMWTAVSAWVPIIDLQTWYFESVERRQKYAGEIEVALGGVPKEGTPAADEAKKRSAMTYLSAARGRRVSISAGIHDGHKRDSVPIIHALRAFNILADPKDRLSDQQITWFTEKESVPPELVAETTADPSYGDKTPLFRRQSNNATVTIFEGGHEILYDAALVWLAAQRR